MDRPQYKAPYFHCKEAFHLRGAFETWTRRRVDELYRHLLAIVKTYASFGTISTVDLGAFKEVFGEADDPLFLCFRHAMLSMESSASRFGPDAIALIVDQARISDLAPLTARVYTLTRRSATISPPERGGG